MIEISVVILTFNSVELIRYCLDTIFAQDYRNCEVIVVDNGSNDGTVDFIKKEYSQVILIENKENLGAAKARNQAIEIAQGKWILALDCDVILEKGFLNKIMSFVKNSDKSIGMFQAKILNMDKTIYSCGIYLSRLRRFYDIGKGRFDNGKFDVSKYIFGACSAAGLYNRQMLEQIREETGYFDERFFFLVEDVDLAWRAQRKGWKALFYPEAICYHYGNSSSSDRPLRQFLCWRNRKFILKKQRLNRLNSALISLFYDSARLVFLVLTNAYVRNEILYKKNGSISGCNAEKR